MAYLITCAGSKRIPQNLNPSTLDHLSFDETLHQMRKQIIDISNVRLNWDYTLPAWQLYSGTRSKIYPQVTKENWNKSCAEVKILSALFGWIKHTDLIPYYDLRMSDRRGNNNQQIWRIWNKMGLLNQLVNEEDIDLLSFDYRKAIHGSTLPVGIIPSVRFTDYGTQKGRWLNLELSKLIC